MTLLLLVLVLLGVVVAQPQPNGCKGQASAANTSMSLVCRSCFLRLLAESLACH
jgi:hypothetical protein